MKAHNTFGLGKALLTDTTFAGSAGRVLSRSVYESANRSPVRGGVPGAAPVDNKQEFNAQTRKELLRRSRYLRKNSGFYREVSDDMAIYSVGDGMTPLAGSTDESWNTEAESYFASWATLCDITERFSFTECQSLACRAMDIDGEMFIIKVRNALGEPRLQLLESHRIGDSVNAKDTIDGIRLNAFGAPISYRVLEDCGVRDVPASAVMHLFEPEQVSGVRAAPSMQHSINRLLDESELLSLEMLAVKDNAAISRTITNDSGTHDDDEDPLPGTPAIVSSDPVSVQRILGGKIVALKPGEDIREYQSNRPSPVFTGFLEALKRDSAAGVLPYEFVHDSSAIGGAGVRLIVTKADRRFSWRQMILIRRFLNAVWGYVIGDAIERGLLKPVSGWHQVEWNTPRRITVDASRDSKENRADVVAGLKTLEDSFAEGGSQFKREIRRRAKNARDILDTAKEFGVPPEAIYNPKA